MVWAGLLGFVAAWVMWEWIYGIGSRVIEDHENYEYASSVHLAGVIASSVSAIACAILSRRPFLSAFLIHLTAGLTFVIIPIGSWQAGVRNYFVALVIWTAIIVWIFRRGHETDRPTTDCTLSTEGAPSVEK